MPIKISIEGNSAGEVKALVADLASALSTIPDERVPVDTHVSTVDKPVDLPEQKPAEIPSLSVLREKARELSAVNDNKAKIKALLTEFGTASITDLGEDQRSAFLARLLKL
jgi:hypothetical protein